MEAQQILDSFKKEVKAGNFLDSDQIEPCDDFFTAVDGEGNLVGDKNLDPQDPKTWGFVLYKRGFCQSTAPPGEPFIKRVGNVLQCQMIGKFLAYDPFADTGSKAKGQVAGSRLSPGVFLVKIGKRVA